MTSLHFLERKPVAQQKYTLTAKRQLHATHHHLHSPLSNAIFLEAVGSTMPPSGRENTSHRKSVNNAKFLNLVQQGIEDSEDCSFAAMNKFIRRSSHK